MRWRLRSGREFTLARHTPEQWGAKLRLRLLALNCKPEYADRVEQQYAAAERA